MKPADCTAMAQAKQHLSDQGKGICDSCILLSPPNVIIKHGCCKVTIPQAVFGVLAEWYLKEQTS